jgi:hypothetical protein
MRLLPDMVRVLAAIAALCLVSAGCGDDDGDSSSGAGNGGSGGSGGGSGGSGSSRDGGPGAGSGGSSDEGSEGWPCTAQSECIGDLTCVGSPITLNGVSIGVCAMACAGDEECTGGGQCITYTNQASDAHCANIVDEEFALCGVADTSLCSEDMTCLYLPGLPVGVCVKLCDPGATAVGDEDAGAALGGCSADQECLPDITTSGEGVCGTVVPRGDTCGIDLGKFCGEGDICAPSDPNDEESEYRCYQDCSENNTCAEGTCMLSQGMFAYCL